ncbi:MULTISPECIES: alpha-glucosidase [unclassified Enterococcus]|uniref:glycoside hydrolase family 13 protein n=1 Tax=unclassified Enterococcus TaxID=2608891 RepID=UPI0015550615|nr:MULTISPECIES: alpha-glucosidase [unclassified Enterococcus]MBS7577008.1 alpha-glucosidase [Enterococcus sp. MMGLQ5-2]MBS7584545.1 alpha-glucosidase [Enterococcus sp. MMGLQ5-1]NPD12400.1 alpha-glucosidase [Enterococcus sp. MMGLQ5-1]NPD36842.1 alpha-glucosidase [Enterococcus sp. MMGLQ5-2]
MHTKRSEWWKDAVIYQIYPKSYNDTTGSGVGDINGIIEKLSYLEALGVDALWLSPVYLSPQIDNGYDITDYRQIDPMFGTNEDMYRLIEQAHQRGIKIIMDFVANHTSDQCSWFQESRKSKDNFFSDFYIWKDGKADGSKPNNWGSSFGGSAWTWDESRKQYYLHYYAAEQPDLNWENPNVRQYIYDMMRFWKQKGVDGWRMDVVTSISKDQDFPDNERDLTTANQQNGPRMHEFIHEMNQEILTPLDMMSVGESPAAKSWNAWELVSPKRQELDMIFTFEHMHIDRKAGDINGRWALQKPDLVALKQIMSNWQNELRDNGWNALYFENHDRARVISRWGNDSNYRYECATAFATILHGLQGTPYIYQGEEIGMTNPKFELDEYEDIELRGNYQHFVEQQKTLTETEFLDAVHKISRDNARTPMQWNSGENAGFTTGKSWFKVNPNYTDINVEQDLKSEQSIFAYYQQLIQLRKQDTMLRVGSYQLLLPEDQRLFTYLRQENDRRWIVLANLSEEMIELNELLELSNITQEKVIISNYSDRYRVMDLIRPYEAFIIEI